MKVIDGSFFLLNETHYRVTFFTMLDISMIFIWLLIIFTLAFYVKSIHANEEHYKYFMPGLVFKLVFTILFSLVYIFYYGGGDSILFFDGTNHLVELMYQRPARFLEELFATPFAPGYDYPYNIRTGFPALTMLREPQSYFLMKFNIFFSMITFKSYLATNIIYSFIIFYYSWKLFEFVRSLHLHSDNRLALAILFIPSVSFWCTSVSKDAIIFMSTIILIRHFFLLIYKKQKSNVWSIFVIIFHIIIIYKIRSVILLPVLTPLVIVFGLKYSMKFKENLGFQRLLKYFIYLGSIFSFFIIFIISGANSKLNEFVKEAETTQLDFVQNTLYTGKKYSSEIIDFSPIGIIQSIPTSIIAGLYRPFPWEISFTLFINGIESFFFLFFTWKFIRRDFFTKWKLITNHEFLLYCFIFIILLSFITGLTSVIFGVLVRLRAPVLVFFAILLTVDMNLKNQLVKTKEEY